MLYKIVIKMEKEKAVVELTEELIGIYVRIKDLVIWLNGMILKLLIK